MNVLGPKSNVCTARLRRTQSSHRSGSTWNCCTHQISETSMGNDTEHAASEHNKTRVQHGDNAPSCRRAVVSRCSDNARARSGNERSKVHLRDSVRNGTILRNRCLSNYRQSTIRFQTKITRFAISPQVEVLRLTKVRKTCDFNRLSDSTMSPLIIAQLSGYSN